MKTTKCTACGRDFSIADETVCDQHLLCPYCGAKFSYLADSPEFSLERLSYALAECRKDEKSDRYYTAAPAGARLYIGLLFYGKVFKDRMDRSLYLAEMAEIEPELKTEDWLYLLENEDDPEMIGYFRSKVPEEHVISKAKGNETESYVKPKIGILRSPSPVRRYPNEPQVSEQTNEWTNCQKGELTKKGRRNVSTYFVIAAGVCGILIAGFILVRLVAGGKTAPEPHREIPALNDGNWEKENLLSEISKRLAELEIRRETVSKSIDEIRADKNRFMSELNRTIENGNIRSAEYQAKGAVRLNGAETAMRVLKAPFFNAFAIRYCGDRPFDKAESCRLKVQQTIDGSNELIPPVVESINQLAIACQESGVGEVRRAINDKFQKMTALRKDVAEMIQTLNREKIEVQTLEANGLATEKEKLRRLFQSTAFTADCSLIDIAEHGNKPASSEDAFVIPDRLCKTASSDRNVAENEEVDRAPVALDKKPENQDAKPAEANSRKTEVMKRGEERPIAEEEEEDLPLKKNHGVLRNSKER